MKTETTTPVPAAMTEERWAELDTHYSPAASVDHASAAVVECLAEIARLERDNARLVDETHRWSAAVKKLESTPTPPTPPTPAATCKAEMIYRRRDTGKVHCRLFKWKGLNPAEALRELIEQEGSEGKWVVVTVTVLDSNPSPATGAAAEAWITDRMPDMMPDEVYGFGEDEDEDEKDIQRCSEDVLACELNEPTGSSEFPAYSSIVIARYYAAGQKWYTEAGYPISVIGWRPLPAPRAVVEAGKEVARG
ncbi:hypothetical protein [Hymenobacter algoricola]|uniref:DUF551 domain-containing protein n=1 Tax=Hymenobacter algoricola TaxID=486267 RepID=A0ABP7N9G4_9BACT